MYIETDELDEVTEQSEPPTIEVDVDEREPRPKTVLVGALALASSILTVLTTIAAVVIATNGTYATSTALAFLAIALSIAGIVGGGVAIVLDRGRRLGVIAAVLGLLANPYLMLVGLEFLSGARS